MHYKGKEGTITMPSNETLHQIKCNHHEKHNKI